MRAHCLFVIVLAACSSGGVEGGETEPSPVECAVDSWSPVDSALATRFQDALDAARAEQNLPGLAMAIAYRGTRQLWVSSTGMANLATGTPWGPCDESRIGSVTKTFTTALIMQLSEEGALSLGDAIETWVPGWYAGPTLEQLLGHTSGIPSYNYVGSFDKSRAWTPEELVQWAYDHEPNLKFPPGTQWDYSNTNYVLLGMVIEKATGQSYGDALRTRLFEPLDLGMRLALADDDSPQLVRCYSGSPPIENGDAEDPSSAWAAGAIVSTPSDLARWTVALYGGELLSAPSLQMMTTPNSVTTTDQEKFGLGTFIETDGEHTLVGHTGGIAGYHAYAYYLQPEELALILMSNLTPTDLRVAANHALVAVLEP